MSSSSSKKIVRKVFYTTGAAIGEVSKIKDGLLDMAKSFQAGYHPMNNASPTAGKDNGKSVKPAGQQLDALYGYLGKIIYENLGEKNLSYYFNAGFEELQKRLEGLLEEIAPSSQPLPTVETQKTENIVTLTEKIQDSPSEDSLTRLKEVVGLSRLNTAQSRLTLLSHLKDPDSLIRRVIVNCINPENGEEETFALVKLINDADEDVARIAIRKSAKTRNRLAFSYLISRLDSENVKIRLEAINALVLITGSDLGFNASASEAGRKEAVIRWQQLWQDNQMNPQFLIDEEATRMMVKKKYIQKTVSKELEQDLKTEPIEKKIKIKTPVTKKDEI